MRSTALSTSTEPARTSSRMVRSCSGFIVSEFQLLAYRKAVFTNHSRAHLQVIFGNLESSVVFAAAGLGLTRLYVLDDRDNVVVGVHLDNIQRHQVLVHPVTIVSRLRMEEQHASIGWNRGSEGQSPQNISRRCRDLSSNHVAAGQRDGP